MNGENEVSYQNGWEWIQRLAILLVCLFGLFQFAHNLADVDLWGNVGFVRELPWQDGYHYTNTFSYTDPDYRWVNHEWGAEYIQHHAHRLFGNAGLLGLKILIGFVLLALMDAELRHERASGPVRFGLLLLVLSTMGYGFGSRPHLFTYLMIVLFIRLLRRGQDQLMVMIAPLLGIVWANLHGAFFIGIVILILSTMASLIPSQAGGPANPRQAGLRLMAALLFFVGSLINPYGLNVWAFIRESAAVTRPYLSEWAPFHPLHNWSDHSDFMALVGVMTAALVITRRRVRPLDIILLSGAFASGILMRRNIPFFALGAALCGGGWVEQAWGGPLRRLTARLRPALAIGLLSVAAILCVIFTVGGHRQRPLEMIIDREAFPVDLMNAMAAVECEANILWFFDWAEYAIWKLPHSRVFLDGRFRSAYSREVIEDYLHFLYGRDGWTRALTDYPTELIVAHIGNPCVPLLTDHPDWTAIHTAAPAIVFAPVDKAERFRALIAEGHARMGNVEAIFP